MVKHPSPPTFGTIQDTGAISLEKLRPKPLTPKEQCKKDGGTWDEKTQTCILVPKKEVAAKPGAVKEESKQAGALFDVKTGKLTGIRRADGKVFFGEPEEIRNLARIEREERELPTGAIDLREEAMQEQAQLEREELAAQVGQFEPTFPIKNKIDFEQAIKSALAGVVPGAAAGAVGAGIALGTVAGAPAAPFIFLAGVAGGFVTGLRSNIKSQKAGLIKGEAASIPDAEKAMLKLIILQNQGIGDPVENVEAFNEQLEILSESYGQLKLDTTDNLALFTGEDGTKQLMKFERFYRGRESQLITEMEFATKDGSVKRNESPELQQEFFEGGEDEI